MLYQFTKITRNELEKLLERQSWYGSLYSIKFYTYAYEMEIRQIEGIIVLVINKKLSIVHCLFYSKYNVDELYEGFYQILNSI